VLSPPLYRALPSGAAEIVVLADMSLLYDDDAAVVAFPGHIVRVVAPSEEEEEEESGVSSRVGLVLIMAKLAV